MEKKQIKQSRDTQATAKFKRIPQYGFFGGKEKNYAASCQKLL